MVLGMNSTRSRLLTVLFLSAASCFAREQNAYAQTTREGPPTDELAAIFGPIAFDSLVRSQGGTPTEIRWFAADTFTFRLLHPYTLNRGLHLTILSGARP